MSKHTVAITTPAFKGVIVQLGFDPRLTEFFLNIDTPTGEATYTSLAEMADKDELWLARVLAARGIALPTSLVQQLAVEAMMGGSNQVLNHGAFEPSTTDLQLLRLGFVQMFMPNEQSGECAWGWFADDAYPLDCFKVSNFTYCLYVPKQLVADAEIVALLEAAEERLGYLTSNNDLGRILDYLEKSLQSNVEAACPDTVGLPFDQVLANVLGYSPCSIDPLVPIGFQEEIDEVIEDARERAQENGFTIDASNVLDVITESANLVDTDLTPAQIEAAKAQLVPA